ncbi:MAG: DUF2442 domain-containing protein [Phycisphaerales bacterium]|nr:DUF2442 domain-containing protein [Phycisphaerales bacterium]
MDILANRPAANRVWFDDANLWVELTDGRTLGVPLAYFPRLQRATPRQRARFEMSGGGTGLHWDSLDEDISVRALVLGRGDQTRTGRRTTRNGRTRTASSRGVARRAARTSTAR